jgi:predicted TIM-barrel fold metal-dependent hydrolase
MFDQHEAVLHRHPDRFAVFAGVDPRWGDDGLRLFEKGVTDYGFSGMKVYPPCGYSPSDEAMFPFYEICSSLGLPVVVHVGETSPALAMDTAAPLLVDRAARAFPRVNFILAHAAGPYAAECGMLCRFRPNVYADVSAFQAHCTAALGTVLSSGVGHKVVFGSDWPVFHLQGKLADQVGLLLGDTGPVSELSGPERQRFFAGTIESLLGQRRAAALDGS